MLSLNYSKKLKKIAEKGRKIQSNTLCEYCWKKTLQENIDSIVREIIEGLGKEFILFTRFSIV